MVSSHSLWKVLTAITDDKSLLIVQTVAPGCVESDVLLKKTNLSRKQLICDFVFAISYHIVQLLLQRNAHNLKQVANSKCNNWAQSTAQIQQTRAAVRISWTLNDFLTSHLPYSILQSIPICTVYNPCGRSRYMIYGVGSRISLYCIRRRMVRLRMRVALLQLMPLRLTRALLLAKIMLFSFCTGRTLCCWNIRFRYTQGCYEFY